MGQPIASLSLLAGYLYLYNERFPLHNKKRLDLQCLELFRFELNEFLDSHVVLQKVFIIAFSFAFFFSLAGGKPPAMPVFDGWRDCFSYLKKSVSFR